MFFRKFTSFWVKYRFDKVFSYPVLATGKCSVIICVILLFCCLAHARTWTNNEGRTIEAEFVNLKGDTVTIKMEGQQFEIPLDSLSAEDQIYSRQEAERRAADAAAEALFFMDQHLEKGKLHIFTFDLSDQNQTIARRGGAGWRNRFANNYPGEWIQDISKTHDLKTITVALGLPDNFDPAIGCPIFVQWTTTGSKSHIRGARRYWDDCRSKGWMLVSVEGSPDPAESWTNSVFYAGIKEFFEQLHKKYPGSQDWPVATGGFSGGAKISQWMGGLIAGLRGVDLRGIWLGGCNEVFFDYAIQDLSVPRGIFRGKKVFISTGNADRLVSQGHRQEVEKGARDAGLTVRSEVYDGGHSVHQAHFLEALDWFIGTD